MMSTKAIPHISNDVQRMFESMADDYLADVFRPWDCFEQTWFDDYTHLFRFESDDLLIWMIDGVLQARRGAIATSDFELTNMICQIKDPDEDDCLSWIPDRAYSELIGQKSSGDCLRLVNGLAILNQN
ncbi:hypothetical protein D5275_10045 [Adlercreutzia muris]|nr:hypothetical protein [Adlercreutzia caecimuris]NCA33054.1 hypothetical protein [Adlercreutzia muris]